MHWHSEVEFIYVKNGTAYLSAGSESHTLEAGYGTFINSKVIHRMDCSGSVIMPNIVFSPTLLAPADSLIRRRYIEPVVNSGIECIIFEPGKETDRKIISALTEVFDVQEEKLGDIKTVELLIKVWYLMYESADTDVRSEMQSSAAHSRSRLQIMMQFIHSNYQQKITLDDIAGSVSISKKNQRNDAIREVSSHITGELSDRIPT